MGREAFESRRSFKQVTTRIAEAAGTVFGRRVSVVDTPGILCPASEENIRSFCRPLSGSCLFLVVLKVDRFTEEHERAVEAALRVVGQRRRHQTHLLFTSGDALDKTLHDFINEDEECPLPSLVRQFNNRCTAFDNKNGGRQQVRELLESSGHLAVVPGGLEQRRVVLLGLSGAGKSSSGNTLLGRESFTSGSGFEAVTADCQHDVAVVEGRELAVLDTPGLSDCNVPARAVAEGILRAVQRTGPEIHAFVVVVKIDRVTREECRLLHALPALFGEDAARYAMVLFTHGDRLEGRSIHDKVTASRFASELVAVCAGRYCVFDNSRRRDQRQVRDFLGKVDQIVAANRGEPCRTADLSGRFPRRSQTRSGPPPLHPVSPDEPEEPLSLWERIVRFFTELIETIRSWFSHDTSAVPYQRLVSY